MILYRYIFREFLTSFIFMTVILTALMYGVFAISTAQQSKDLGIDFVIMNSWPLFVQVLPYTILAGLVVGATISYGRLASDNEIDAVRVTGIQARSVLRPAFMLGLALSAASFYLHADAVPRAYDQQRLNKRSITLWLLKNPPAGPRNLDIQRIRFSYMEAHEGTFKQLTLIKLGTKDLSAKEKILAPVATIDFSEETPVVVMPEATVTYYDDKLFEVHTKDCRVPLDVEPYKNYNPRPKYRDWEQLGEAFELGFPAYSIWREMITRIAKGFLPLPLALMGAALGVLVRKASKMAGLGLSLPPLALALILTTVAEGIEVRDVAMATVTTFAPLVVTWVAALVTVYRIKV